MGKSYIKIAWTALLMLCLLTAATAPVLALTDQEKAMFDESSSSPLTFTISASRVPDVIDKANELIAETPDRDTGLKWMNVKVSTATSVTTYPPGSGGMVGFTVTCVPKGNVDEVTVAGLIYKGPFIAGPDDKKNAMMRVHLLAYLLEKSLTEATTQAVQTPYELPSPVPNPVAPAPGPALPDDLDAYMKLIRQQLLDHKYDTALATIKALESAVTDKKNAPDSVYKPSVTN